MDPQIITRDVTIQALRRQTRKELSAALNPVMVILTKDRKSRDWYGLLELCKIKPQYVAAVQRNEDPTEKVLNLWYETDPEHSTIQQLLLFLEELDRFDVIEDITELIDEDIKVYKENPQEIGLPNLEADKYIITTEDVIRISEGRPLEIYDAFLLYDHEDIEFAIQLLDTLEKVHGMKFLAKDRDVVGGGLELDKIIKIITERCNRIVVILSDSFFRSQANQYYLSFAHAYGIEERARKIIPCTYKECTLPRDMKYLFILDYRRMMKYNYDFWEKLKKSIEAPVNNVDKSRVNRSHSDNGQNVRLALQENYLNGLKPVNKEVKFNSVSNLHRPEIDQPVNPIPSATSVDDIRPFKEKKEKSSNWFKKIKNHIKKDRSNKHKEKRRAAAITN